MYTSVWRGCDILYSRYDMLIAGTSVQHVVSAPGMIKARIIEGAYELCCHICQHKATSTEKYVSI